MPKITLVTGIGRGKTSAAIGKVIQYLQKGKSVAIVQFLKTGKNCGECNALITNPSITWMTIGQEQFYYPGKDTKEKLSKLIDKKIIEVEGKLKEKKVNLLVLDELAIALYFTLINWEKIEKMLSESIEEVIITGRNPPKFLVKYVDSVITITEINHPYTKGIHARKGIDY